MNLKKKIMAVIAAAIMLLAVSPVFADNDDALQTQTQQVTELTNDKYLTKGGAAFWFVFTIVINGALSFWIGNRFYRLAKRENHVSAEIRALRRDIDDKFVKSVDGFAEQEIEIENLNDIFSLKDEPLKAPKKKPSIKELSPEEEERFRRWEEAQSKPKTEKVKAAAKPTLREELEEDFDDVKKVTRRNYKPQRDDNAQDGDETAYSDNLEETRVIKPVGEGVKNKAKEILGDIFPFKED